MGIILSLDIGTSKLCAMAFCTQQLQPLVIRTQPNRLDVVGLQTGWHEQEVVQIREEALELLKVVGKEAGGEIVGISITGQMHGVLLVDKSLAPLSNLITWRDQRVLDGGINLEEMKTQFKPLTGCGLHAGYGGATLAWLAREGLLKPDIKAVTIADYMASLLTGRLATEPTHAASWGIYNLHRGNWEIPLVTRLGITPEVLPEIIPTMCAQGNVTEYYRRRLGLTGEVQVAATIGDNQACILGAAGLADDAMVLNLGTGGQISVVRRHAEMTVGMETRPMPFGHFILVGASLCGGWSYAYLMQFFQQTIQFFTGIELPDDKVYETMNRLAAEATMRPNIPQMDTRFAGTRSEPKRKGALTDIDTSNLTPGQLVLASIRGMVHELLHMVPSTIRAEIRQMVASGNAVRKNPMMQRVIAEQFGRSCKVSEVQEEAVLGAARAACVGLGYRRVEDLRRELTY
jgi:sedoheptulokinase